MVNKSLCYVRLRWSCDNFTFKVFGQGGERAFPVLSSRTTAGKIIYTNPRTNDPLVTRYFIVKLLKVWVWLLNHLIYMKIVVTNVVTKQSPKRPPTTNVSLNLRLMDWRVHGRLICGVMWKPRLSWRSHLDSKFWKVTWAGKICLKFCQGI